MRVPQIKPYGDPDQPDLGRAGELALAFQEAFTVLVRLRAGRQIASDADSFRAHVKRLLTAAHQDLQATAYPEETARLGVYAYVAFLDESILGSGQPMFSGWSRQPLQEEVFGDHTAGETFFQHLDQLLNSRAGRGVADVLEVFQLCLLLGFKGRYRDDPLQLDRYREAIDRKIETVRGVQRSLAPDWQHPAGETVAGPRDPVLRSLTVTAGVLLVAVGVAFVIYTVLLGGGIEDLRSTAFRVLG